jgi:NTP pyrophosphatase (non-canonical NTP hydrolase)
MPQFLTEPEYAGFVASRVKDPELLLQQVTAEKLHQIHMATGLSTEAGELLSAFKASVFYNKPLDMANVIEELGDIEFYLEGVRALIGVTRQEVLAGNVDKLSKRYKDKFTDEQAKARADKEQS